MVVVVGVEVDITAVVEEEDMEVEHLLQRDIDLVQDHQSDDDQVRVDPGMQEGGDLIPGLAIPVEAGVTQEVEVQHRGGKREVSLVVVVEVGAGVEVLCPRNELFRGAGVGASVGVGVGVQ